MNTTVTSSAGLEDVVYSAVEHIPFVGTVYAFERVAITRGNYDENDKRFWASIANLTESAVRDVVLFSEAAEPTPVVIIHRLVDFFTNKLMDIYTSSIPTMIEVASVIDKTKSHVLVAGSNKRETDDIAAELFRGKAKGIHHFHGAVFIGTLTEPCHAPNGEKIWLQLPEGFYDGAPCMFIWRWTVDSWGETNRPEDVHGRLKLEPGRPTRFKLAAKRRLHDFSGVILGKNTIEAKTRCRDQDVIVIFTRVGATD